MQPLPFNPCRFEDAVVPSAEVHRARVVAVLVGNERRVLAKVSIRAQIEDRIDGRLIQWHVSFARCTLELADLDLPAAGELHAISFEENLISSAA
ncbi:MAG: hypothetical protein J1E06_01345 [Acutalibacter sp.]|nr:hypothetical protein [Acutalibacter sp.]